MFVTFIDKNLFAICHPHCNLCWRRIRYHLQSALKAVPDSSITPLALRNSVLRFLILYSERLAKSGAQNSRRFIGGKLESDSLQKSHESGILMEMIEHNV